jgi:hypothetical protein
VVDYAPFQLLISAVEVLIWPTALLYVVWKFEEQIRQKLNSSNSVKIEVFGCTINLDSPETVNVYENNFKRSATLATHFGAAVEKWFSDRQRENKPKGIDVLTWFSDRQKNKEPGGIDVLSTGAQFDVLAKLPYQFDKLQEAKILWVDKDHQSLHYEINGLRQVDTTLFLEENNDEAMTVLESVEPDIDIVITNASRNKNTLAGYELSDMVEEYNEDIPVIMYASLSGEERHKRRDRLHNVDGNTNKPPLLLRFILENLQEKNTLTP